MKATVKVSKLPSAPEPTKPVRVDKYGQETVIRRWEEITREQRERIKGKQGHHEPWSDIEIIRLKRLRANGYTTQQIADDLERSKASVKAMLTKLLNEGVIPRKRYVK